MGMRGMAGWYPCLLDASDTIIHGNSVPCPRRVLRLPRGFEWGLRLCIPGLCIPLLLLEASLGLLNQRPKADGNAAIMVSDCARWIFSGQAEGSVEEQSWV